MYMQITSSLPLPLSLYPPYLPPSLPLFICISFTQLLPSPSPSLSLSLPFSLSLSLSVKAEIVTPVPHLTEVQSGHDINLSCSARGTNLTFQWSYKGNTYDSTSDCPNGICVNTELSSSDPLSMTSHLSIRGSETTVEGDTTVTCRVTQRVDDRFGSIPLTSIGTVTVYDEVVTTSK